MLLVLNIVEQLHMPTNQSINRPNVDTMRRNNFGHVTLTITTNSVVVVKYGHSHSISEHYYSACVTTT